MLSHQNLRFYTMIELLITISVLAILVSLLNPSLNSLIENSHRLKCSNNLRLVAVGATTFANDFDGIYPICRNKSVQIAFNTSDFQVLSDIGWGDSKTQKMDAIWNCPSREFVTNRNDLYGQIIIGYQYFGGINRWRNPQGWFPSRSPQYSNSTEPGWVLAADTTAKIDHQWGGGRSTAYADMPSHKLNNSLLPAGSNQVYADGSVEWIEFLDQYYLHAWGGPKRAFYFYQKDLGSLVPSDTIKAQY